MIKKISLLIVLIGITGITFASCRPDYIRSKTDDGSLITLFSDISWEIENFDRESVSTWRAGDSVFVCDDEAIIHKERGEKVNATRVI